jgi:hypothetical protein
MPDWHGVTGRPDLVGAVRIDLDGDGCDHQGGNVCQWCAGLSDDEVAALREYFRLTEEQQ